MKKIPFKPKKFSLCVATACLVSGASFTQANAATVTHDVSHTFSIQDVQGGFDGSTFGPAGALTVPAILCDAPGAPACPPGAAQSMTDSDGDELYPVDSEFGFYVVDFLGAQGKTRDLDYGEGWVGNIEEGGEVVGLKLSNAKTDRYKVKAPLGTWCAGLGGNSVKCSSEHYVVMEHVLSCHEVVPYFFADPVTGEQDLLSFPDGSASFDCTAAGLDDELIIYEGGLPSGVRLTDATPGAQMHANDNTSVLHDIAASTDYSVTLKDDGKALYRWGALIKRPNDLRVYAKLDLPDEWKDNPTTAYTVTKARLLLDHWITNNPNDQVRPEDMENEGATGRKPDYLVENAGTADELWRSTKTCYEGDGDFLDTEEGSTDPTVLGIGTYYKNMPFTVDGTDADEPLPFSEDLQEGFTNAWFTTIDRDPFEWSYRDVTTDPSVFNFIGSPLSDDTLGELVSGPRWRLKPNKYGQDIPGLEVIRDAVPGVDPYDCVAPPPAKNDIKYEVGERVTTELNLLDFEDINGDGDITNDSPLNTSLGWIDAANNFQNLDPDENPSAPNGVSINGLPLTEDFDLAIYVKGDRKPTAIYSARLLIEYEGDGIVDPGDGDVIDFEEIATGQYPTVSSMGYVFSPVFTYRSIFIRDDGNKAMQPLWNEWLDMGREDGADFNLTSFDYRPQWRSAAGEVLIEGYKSDGTVLTDSFTYDGSIVPTTKTLNWTGLESVVFRLEATLQFDNFVVSQDDMAASQ